MNENNWHWFSGGQMATAWNRTFKWSVYLPESQRDLEQISLINMWRRVHIRGIHLIRRNFYRNRKKLQTYGRKTLCTVPLRNIWTWIFNRRTLHSRSSNIDWLSEQRLRFAEGIYSSDVCLSFSSCLEATVFKRFWWNLAHVGYFHKLKEYP